MGGKNDVTFTATKEGTGDDNPSDPLDLTEVQENKAVTVTFADKADINFEVGATAGRRPRVFSFIFRPSLLCAQKVPVKEVRRPTSGGGKPKPAEGSSFHHVPSL